jgi:hypothetical protein
MKLRTVQVRSFKSIVDSGPLALGPITLFVGRNNAGKSSVLRAISLLQSGNQVLPAAIRKGADSAAVELVFDFEGEIHFGLGSPSGRPVELNITVAPTNNRTFSLHVPLTNYNSSVNELLNTEPYNLLYPYFSGRRAVAIEEAVDQQRSLEVRNDHSNLAAKVDRLNDPNHPAHAEFISVVDEVIGVPLSAIASPKGKQVGTWVNEIEWIPIEQMGDGIPQLLGLIVHLCIARNKIFLIEELENDIHPEALKALLRLIERKAASNQFVISTHNNVVLRHLGAVRETLIYKVDSQATDLDGYRMRDTTFNAVSDHADERVGLLRGLGYELSDLDLHDGWLILEESSAERVIREFLIPWFVPELTRIQTVASRGTGDLDRTVEALSKLVLFTHLEPQYRDRVQVLADGEQSGEAAIEALRLKYPAWRQDAFLTFDRPDFELYYPEAFQEEVAAILSTGNSQTKRELKRDLLKRVLDWARSDEGTAKTQFQASASSVIEQLQYFATYFAAGR